MLVSEYPYEYFVEREKKIRIMTNYVSNKYNYEKEDK